MKRLRQAPWSVPVACGGGVRDEALERCGRPAEGSFQAWWSDLADRLGTRAPPPTSRSRCICTPWAISASSASAKPHTTPSTVARVKCAAVTVARSWTSPPCAPAQGYVPRRSGHHNETVAAGGRGQGHSGERGVIDAKRSGGGVQHTSVIDSGRSRAGV